MITAVTRRFLAEQGHEHYAVMRHFAIGFRRFPFPPPAELMLSLDAYGDDSAGMGRDTGAGCDRTPFEVTIAPGSNSTPVQGGSPGRRRVMRSIITSGIMGFGAGVGGFRSHRRVRGGA